MIAALKNLFISPESDTEETRSYRIKLVAAAMLIETARADFTHSIQEQTALEGLLHQSLGLPGEEIESLISAAEQRVDEAVSLYEFTRTINDYYSAAEKLQLIQSMWQVAYADGELDKYEEHLIRKVAELIYVPHQDYIRSKLDANT